MAYVVTAGAVTVEMAIQEGGRARRDVYRGHVLPDDVPAEQVAKLLELGHIAAVEEPADAPAKKPAKR